MRLNRLKLRNWCQLRELDIPFADGLTAIRGPIGSGKTNACNGIVFALTGDLKRLPGIKTDNICQLAGEGEESGVDLEFTHGDVTATVTRNVKPNNQKLHIHGQDPKFDLKNAGEIEAKIESLLGVNTKLLLDYVFVKQWGIFDFIDQKPEQRAKAFAELFNVEKAEVIWKALGDHAVDIPVPSINGDAVRARISTHLAELDGTSSELVEYDDLPLEWIESTDPNFVIINDYNQFVTVTARRQGLFKQFQDLKATLAEKHTAEDAVTKQHSEYDGVISSMRDQADTAKAALTSWSTYSTLMRSKASLEQRLALLKTERANQQHPHQPHLWLTDEELVNAKHKLDELRSQLLSTKKILDNFDAGRKLTQCPTCLTSVQDLIASGLFERLNKEKAADENRLAQYTEAVTTNDRFRQATKQYHERKDRLLSDEDDLRKRLIDLQTVDTPTVDLEEAKQIVEDWKVVEAERAEIFHKLHRLRQESANLKGRATALKTQLLDMDSQLSKLTVTEQQATVAKTLIEETRHRVQRRNELTARAAVLRKTLTDDEDSLVRLAEEEKAAGKLRRHVAHLKDVRTVFKELPRHASQACLEAMHEKMDEILEQFDVPFRIKSIQDLKFIIKKHSGAEHSADRLSGGQRVLFAIAFRLVVNLKFADQLGLLCLDEPTAGLDADSLRCVDVALKWLRELSKSQGLQVLLVTHDDGLDHLFDRVVKLPAAT